MLANRAKSKQIISVRKILHQLQDDMIKTTHFTKDEIEGLFKKFNSELPKDAKMMDRTTFRDLLHKEFKMTDDMVMDRVFKAFDVEYDGKISVEEYVAGMSIFLKGTTDEKINFAFDVYDMNSDGYISKEEMFHMLKNCLHHRTQEEDADEGIKDLVDMLLKKVDVDNDGRISKTDFTTSVYNDPLLMECLGQCMPGNKLCQEFIKKIMEDCGFEYEEKEDLVSVLPKREKPQKEAEDKIDAGSSFTKGDRKDAPSSSKPGRRESALKNPLNPLGTS